ncbi:hypothetical protein [Caenispirillum bisanense]|uniref:hypothetical protein n=1 Tax=Caenispirillum bisanense TaxID=414052 RepID=UPI0031E39FBD
MTGEDIDLSTPPPATSSEPEAPAAPEVVTDDPPVVTPPAPPTGGDTPVDTPDPRQAQTPTLLVADAAGVEDLAIRLNITVGTNDTDGGNETLTVIIRGVPNGFSFTDGGGAAVGSAMGGGAWLIPTDKLADLWFVRPEHYSGEVPLVVEVTSREVTGHTSTVSTPLTVQIEAVADAPDLSAVDSAGTENEWIALSVNSALVDADGSETLTVYITDVPPGAQLSAGTQLTEALDLPGGLTLPVGTWVLSPGDLGDLKVLPAANDSADFTLKVYAVTEEALNGDRAVSGPAEINVDVGVVAPSVGGTGGGREDEWADVSLSAAVNAGDGSERLFVYIEDLPANVLIQLKDGTALAQDADGRYIVPTDRLNDVQVRWDPATAEHSDADISFNVRAVVQDVDVGTDRETARDTNQSVSAVTVTVSAVADAPTVTAGSTAAGVENTAIALDVSAALVDADGSESLIVYITGVPDGAVLSKGAIVTDLPAGVTAVGGTVTWAIPVASAADLAGLTVTPPTDDSRDFTLKVYGVSEETNPTEAGDVAVPQAVTGPRDIHVDVGVVAPAVSVSGSGLEDQWANVTLDSAINARLGDGSETLTVYLENVPSNVLVRYADGTPVTFTGGRYVIDGEQAGLGLQMKWDSPAHTDADITFDVRAVVVDSDGDSNETVVTGVTVAIDAVADEMTLAGSGRGNEDTDIPVAVRIDLIDQDGSERLLGQDGSQPGSVWLVSSSTALAAGTLSLGGLVITGRAVTGYAADGITPLFDGDTPLAGDDGKPVLAYELPATAFTPVTAGGATLGYNGPAGLTFRPEEHSDADVSFTVVATVLDNDGSVRASSGSGSIEVVAVADAPTLTVKNAAGMENKPIALEIDSALVDRDGSETLTVYITGVPAGAVIAKDGAALTAVTAPVTVGGITMPAGSTYAIVITADDVAADKLAGLTVTSPLNNSSDFQLKVHAVTAEARDGDVAVKSASLDVHVGTEAPTLTIADVVMSERTSLSDNWQAIDIQAIVNAQHKVDGSAGDTETLKVMIYDVPAGVRLQANGTVLTPDSSGKYVLTQSMLTSVKISTEMHNDADFSFKAKALVEDVDVGTSWETPAADATAPDSAWSDEVVVNVTVKAEADAANLSASGVGVEDKLFKLNLAWSAKDATESVTDVKLSGLLADTTIQYKDTVTGQTVTVTVGSDGVVDLTTADQSTVMAKWPENKNNFVNSSTGHKGELTLSVTTTEHGSADGGGQIGAATHTTSTTFNVRVFGDADKPYGDTDEAVKIIAEDDWHRVKWGADDADGVDGKLASGDVFAALRDLDGSEDMVIRIKPTVTGSRLAISTDDTITSGEIKAIGGSGYWEVSYSDISGGRVHLQAPPNWSGDNLSFEFTAVSRESDRNVSTAGTGVTRSGTATEVIGTLNFKVTPVADNVTLGTVAGGNEDGAGRDITVTPTVTLQDTDGSERLTSVVMVSSDPNLAVGSVLIGGAAVTRLAVTGYDDKGFPVLGGPDDVPATDAAGNQVYAWVLDGAFNLGSPRTSYTGSGITVLPKEHSSQEIKYSLVAEVTETANGATQKTMVTDRVITIDAVADKPDLVLTGLKEEAGQRVIEGREDTAISLGIDARLVDRDGSEVLGVTVSGVPAGWVIGYQTADGKVVEAARLGDGTYDLGGDPDRLATVVVVPPKNLHTELSGGGANAAPTFTITATATETGSDGAVAVKTATSTETFKVIVQAVADEPFLVVRDARVNEDAGPVKINITADVTDKVNAEQLTVFVKGVPDGAKLIGAGGVVITETVEMNGETWYVVTDHVHDLKVEPKEHSNDDFNLTVRAVSTESSNGDTAHNDATVRVTVVGTVDKPTWNGTVVTDSVIPVDVGAKEDGGPFNPGLGKLGTEDTDGSETITLVLRGIPAGVEIFMAPGSEQFMKYIGGGRWAVDGAHLDDVRIVVTDKNFSGTKDVAIDLVVTENDGATKTFTHTLEVQIDPVADAPSVSLSGGGAEDSFGAAGVPVTITVLPTDTVFEAEQITHISVDFGDMGLTGLKAEIIGVDGTTTRVVDIGGGVEFDLSGPDLATFYDAATGKMGEIRITGLPDHWSADIPVTVKATSAHGDGEGKITMLATSVEIYAVADPAKVFTVTPSDAAVASGNKIALGVDLQLADTDGSESRYLIVEGVPENARLTGGFNAGNGRWIVSGDAIDSLQVEGAGGVSGTLKVIAMVRDLDPDDHAVTTWKSEPITVPIRFDGDGSGGGTLPGPLDDFVELYDLRGKEDEPVVLRGTTTRDGAAAPSDVSAVILTILTVGVTVASTTKGAFAYYQDEHGNIVIPVESLKNGLVQLTPPQDSDAPISFTMQVVVQGGEGDFRSDTIMRDTPKIIPIKAVVDGVTISSDVEGKSFAEDTESVAVSLKIAPNERANFSETFTDDEPKIVIRATGLPVDAKLELNGVALTQDSDGAYRIDVSAFGANVADPKSALAAGTTLELSGLTVKPPADWHGSVTLDVSVSISDNGTDPEISAGKIAFKVTPVTETGTFTLPTEPVMATEDTAFDITATLNIGDRIGSGAAHASEYVSVVIRGVPEGAVLSGASNNGSYTVGGVTYTEWVVKDGNIAADGALTGVKMTPPADWSGTMTLEIKAFTMEGDVRQPVEAASGTWQVVVKGVADMASIDPQNVPDALEDTPTRLTLNAQLSDLTGETLWVVIKGVPAGAAITDAAGNKLLQVQVGSDGKALFDADGNPVTVAAGGAETGVWVVDQAHADNAHFLGAENFSGTVNLTAYVVTKEDGTTATSPELPFKVTVQGVADAPDLDLPTAPVVGAEDQARGADGLPVASSGIALGLAARLNDPDGETLKLIITGAPADTLFFGKGTTPYVAELIGSDLVWTIDGGDIADLRMVTPPDWNGTITLGLEARALEGSTTASTFASLDVEVTPTNDAPTIGAHTTGQIIGNGGDPIRIFPDGDGTGASVVIADVDVGDYLKAMMVAITNGRQPGDTLGITGQTVTFNPYNGRLEVEVDGAQIAISYEAGTNTLTFSGDASHAVYQKLAESVILTSGDGTLDAGVRDFTVTVVDSAGATGTITAQANIQDDLTLDDGARGNLFFTTADTATLVGTGGDDLFVYGVGADPANAVTVIDTAGGADTLVMMDSTGAGSSWIEEVEGPATITITPTDGTGGLVYEVEVDKAGGTDGGSADSGSGSGGDAGGSGGDDSSGTVTFDDHAGSAGGSSSEPEPVLT